MMVHRVYFRVCVCELFLCKISLVQDDDVKSVVCVSGAEFVVLFLTKKKTCFLGHLALGVPHLLR